MALADICSNCKAPVPVPRPAACPHCNAAFAEASASDSTDAATGAGFSGFLRENWMWIVAPIAVAVVLIIVLAVFFQNDDTNPFIYNIW